MRDPYQQIVHDSLERYLRKEQGTIHPRQRLQEDLGLDAFDLTSIALGFQRLTGSVFPVDLLHGLGTVADLTRLVRSWARQEIQASAAQRTRSSHDIPTTCGVLVDPKGIRKSR